MRLVRKPPAQDSSIYGLQKASWSSRTAVTKNDSERCPTSYDSSLDTRQAAFQFQFSPSAVHDQVFDQYSCHLGQGFHARERDGNHPGERKVSSMI